MTLSTSKQISSSTSQRNYQSIESAFDKPENRMPIVANKFQTGFNQKKLCAMYIDKRISNDIEIVQTHSRLNRTFPGKGKVFVIDFVNDPSIVVNAFKKYDTGAEMESTQRLEIIYEIKEYLYQAGIESIPRKSSKPIRWQNTSL